MAEAVQSRQTTVQNFAPGGRVPMSCPGKSQIWSLRSRNLEQEKARKLYTTIELYHMSDRLSMI